MKKGSAEVDRYIENAPRYAQPILKRIRKAFHQAQPDVVETIKWRAPHFEHNGVLAGVAAFKSYVGLNFWKAKLMRDPEQLLMGGMSFKSEDDLPTDKVLLAYIREAVRLNEEGTKVERKPSGPAKAEKMPPDLAAALKKSAAARATFEKFPQSQKNEYIVWITQAKQEATRQKRVATAIEWMSEGKPRNWKYMKKW